MYMLVYSVFRPMKQAVCIPTFRIKKWRLVESGGTRARQITSRPPHPRLLFPLRKMTSGQMLPKHLAALHIHWNRKAGWHKVECFLLVTLG